MKKSHSIAVLNLFVGVKIFTQNHNMA